MSNRDLCKRDNSPKISKFTTDQTKFEWAGYNWQSCMEGGRLIHPGVPYQWYDINQVHLQSDGSVALTIAVDPKDIHHWDGHDYKPIMACGTMRSIETFKFGTFSAEIKMPHGLSLWPSFWCTGVGRWPENGELDINEGWSDNNRYFRWFIPQPPYLSPSWRTTTNVHYKESDSDVHESIGSRNVSFFKQCKDPSNNFIKYECEWTPDKITFKVNGKIIREDTYSARKIVQYAGKTRSGKPVEDPAMRVIFNVWCEDPSDYQVKMYSPMVIRNFKYTPYDRI